MEICPPEKLTNVSHFISRGLFCNYQKDVAARRAAISMFWFKENQSICPPDSTKYNKKWAKMRCFVIFARRIRCGCRLKG